MFPSSYHMTPLDSYDDTRLLNYLGGEMVLLESHMIINLLKKGDGLFDRTNDVCGLFFNYFVFKYN